LPFAKREPFYEADYMMPASSDVRRLSQSEFIALMAMLFATIAFSIDSMLPAMPQIAAELSPLAPNQAQLVITSFVLGMGIGTMFSGPLSDAFGRKPVIIGGAVIYAGAAAFAYFAQSLEAVLLARVVQGIGAAGPRVAALAIVRDLYSGRQMARMMSLIFLIFSLFPAVAPALGQLIIWGVGWRGIFGAFIVFALISATWLGQRQPETLAVENQRPFRPAQLWQGLCEVAGNRIVLCATAVQALCLGTLFTVLSATQQVFDITYGYGDSFPLWFALIAIMAASASLLNAALVERWGMRFLIKLTLGGQIVLSGSLVILWSTVTLPPVVDFALFVVWVTSVFFQAGMTLGNLNALAMEPMGHRAGMAASVVGSVSTVLAVAIAAPVGQLFDGTALPLTTGVLVCVSAAFVLMQGMGRG
jgi:DHA1 family bicyclomycin/chloramphenicol resistance-like MFS transporter